MKREKLKAQKDILNKELIGFEFDGFNEAFTSQRWSRILGLLWSGGVAAMKHSLCSYEAMRTQVSPWAEGSLHRTELCFIFHAPKVRFIEKPTSRNLSVFLAERVGFEPTWAFTQTVFKTASLWPLRYLSEYSVCWVLFSIADILYTIYFCLSRGRLKTLFKI